MSKLRKLAIKVDVDNSSSQDVTEEFVDLDARMKVYEATEQQLLKFLEKTQSVDESLKVYRELTNVRSQIESLKGRMNYLQKSADMSGITVQLKGEEKEKPIVEESGWNPGKVVRDALRSLVTGLQNLLNLLIYVGLFILPILLIVGIVFLIVRAIWRRLRRSRAK
jgi:ABC-type multidrug transport system fused ATPase/permease subunit